MAPRLEILEGRQLMDTAMSKVVADFNVGVVAIRANLGRLGDAWDRDLADVPLIRAQPARAMGLGELFGKSLPKAIVVSDSIDAVKDDLVAREAPGRLSGDDARRRRQLHGGPYEGRSP